MTYASTAERLAEVIDRLEAGGTYQEERESLFDIYAGLDDTGSARQVRRDEADATPRRWPKHWSQGLVAGHSLETPRLAC